LKWRIIASRHGVFLHAEADGGGELSDGVEEEDVAQERPRDKARSKSVPDSSRIVGDTSINSAEVEIEGGKWSVAVMQDFKRILRDVQRARGDQFRSRSEVTLCQDETVF
jgi:hypothetical protein